MSSELAILSIADVEAAAIGDRLRGAGILKKLRDALGNLDPEKLQNLIGLVGKLLDLFGGALPSAQSVEVLCVEDAQAAGILDNAELWIALFTKLMALIQRLRG